MDIDRNSLYALDGDTTVPSAGVVCLLACTKLLG